MCLRCEAKDKMLRKQARQAYDYDKRVERLKIQLRTEVAARRRMEKQLARVGSRLNAVKMAVGR